MRISDWSSDVCSSDLTGMEIEDRWLPVFPRDAAQGPARDAVGQQAEVAAANTRQVAAAQAKRGDRHLDEGVPVARPEAEAGGIRHAVVVGADRIDAGAVVVALLGQHVERPERDRKSTRLTPSH